MQLDPRTVKFILGLIFDRIELANDNPFSPDDLTTLESVYGDVSGLIDGSAY